MEPSPSPDRYHIPKCCIWACVQRVWLWCCDAVVGIGSGLERCIADGQCRCRSGWLAGADRMMPVVGERALEFDARGCLQTGDSKLDVVMDESSWACSIPFVR